MTPFVAWRRKSCSSSTLLEERLATLRRQRDAMAEHAHPAVVVASPTAAPETGAGTLDVPSAAASSRDGEVASFAVLRSALGYEDVALAPLPPDGDSSTRVHESLGAAPEVADASADGDEEALEGELFDWRRKRL